MRTHPPALRYPRAQQSCGWLDWPADPSHGVYPANPPGPEGSKGTRALAGVRGVVPFPARRG